ncbi:peptidoglycan DD-metalloendopeptidase family protein [Rhodonellum sp.]|uniref:peptidoglycan DD-metalloendopeptidase family protein n=1 Tax=Rhodonellum sp. TaxID=2231180 RepID=UPI002727C096|nr:peptidoglycan DD-metalloendopeptidase family protein [Rhodonellum sp.]MDO9551661.1 peptidoglycan DD-metalloendopeptidase family protein [Rhodonellum sp.]
MGIKIEEGNPIDKIFILRKIYAMSSLPETLAQTPFYPIMGINLTELNTRNLDFSPNNPELEHLDLSNTAAFDGYVSGLLESEGKDFGIGGYFEKRAIYRRSAVFATAEEDFRDIHLGIDIWGAAGSPVFAPLEGKVHSFQDNAGFGNYGPTIILEHALKGFSFYTLYGHLSRADIRDLEVGKVIAAGSEFCRLGPYPENGDWPPHLHFQVMVDLLGMKGDFPGVCSHREIEKYRRICLDPNLLIGFPKN